MKGTNAGVSSLYFFHFVLSPSFLSMPFSSMGTPETYRMRMYSRIGEAAAATVIHDGYQGVDETTTPVLEMADDRAERERMYWPVQRDTSPK